MVAIASVPDPFGIAVDARNVYWTDLGTALGVVVSMPLSGGAQTTLAAGGFDTITLNEGYVYLSATQRVPSGGLPLDATISYSGGLAFDGTNVYWGDTGGVNQENGFLVRSQVAGGGITTLVSLGQYEVGSIGIDSSSLYWVAAPTRLGTPVLVSMPLAGGSVTTLLSGDAVPGQMVIAGGTIYGLSGAVTSMPLGGSSVVTLASTFYADNSSEPLVVDDVNVYWPEFEAGKVLMVPRSGGRVTTLASGRNGPRSVAVDSSYVYWTDRDHDILKVAIP